MENLRQQLETAILKWTHEAHLSPGESLPSERQLAQRFGASQATIHRAMISLTAQGKLKRKGNRRLLVGNGPPNAEAPTVPCVTIFVDWKLSHLCPLAAKLATQLGLSPFIEVDEAVDGSNLRQVIRRARKDPTEKLVILHLSLMNNLTEANTSGNPNIVGCSLGVDSPASIGVDHESLYDIIVAYLARSGCRQIGLLCPPWPGPENAHKLLFRHSCHVSGIEKSAEAHGYPYDVEATLRGLQRMHRELTPMDALVLWQDLLSPEWEMRPHLMEFIESQPKPLKVVAVDLESIFHHDHSFPVMTPDWETQLRIAFTWLKQDPLVPLSGVRVKPRWYEPVSPEPPADKPVTELVYGTPLRHPWPSREYYDRPYRQVPKRPEPLDLKPWLNRLVNRHRSWLGDQPLKGFSYGRKCLAGIPFDIAPDAQGRGAACIVLRSKINRKGLQGPLPDRVEIPVQRNIDALYILSACGWVASCKPLARYELLTQTDAKFVKNIIPLGSIHPSDIPTGIEPNIQDWWPEFRPVAQKDVRPVVVERDVTPGRMRYLYAMRWSLAKPQYIESLSVQTTSDAEATLAILAITLALAE